MTPEEKAVIQAAIAFVYGTPEKRGSHALLLSAVEQLPPDGVYTPDKWHPATFADLFPGDRVRIGQEESDVLKATRGQWHAKNRVWIDDAGRERDHQRPWEHEELRIDFSAYPGLRVYPPETECEILCDAERTALLLLQRGFPGSTIVS